jgi:hypothetical protein
MVSDSFVPAKWITNNWRNGTYLHLCTRCGPVGARGRMVRNWTSRVFPNEQWKAVKDGGERKIEWIDSAIGLPASISLKIGTSSINHSIRFSGWMIERSLLSTSINYLFWVTKVNISTGDETLRNETHTCLNHTKELNDWYSIIQMLFRHAGAGREDISTFQVDIVLEHCLVQLQFRISLRIEAGDKIASNV